MGDCAALRYEGGGVMVGVTDAMTDAIGALRYAADALDAPDRSHMRETEGDLMVARETVAQLVDYAERLLGFAYSHGDMTALRAGGGMLDGARAVIDKAKGEA